MPPAPPDPKSIIDKMADAERHLEDAAQDAKTPAAKKSIRKSIVSLARDAAVVAVLTGLLIKGTGLDRALTLDEGQAATPERVEIQLADITR